MTRQPALVAILLIGSLPAPCVYAADADQSFLNKAAEGGLAEVDAGKLAQSKGASKEVRDFGAMMVADHSKANEKLKGVAARKNVKLPAELNETHKVMKRELEAASGQAFDAAYIKGQIADHEAVKELLAEEIQSGTDADAKTLAKEMLPTVKSHLSRAREISRVKAPSQE